MGPVHRPRGARPGRRALRLDSHASLPLYLAGGLGIAALALLAFVFIAQKHSRSRERAAEKIVEGEKREQEEER